MVKILSKVEAIKLLGLDEKISSQIKMFERIHNGIEEAFVDVTKIRRVHDELFCTITIHDDDFSSKTVYQDVVYPSEIIKLI